jgi:hypothetical protein
VLQTVLSELELRPVERRSERVARSSIAFVPERRALAVVTRRAPARAARGEHVGQTRTASGLPVG